MPYKYNFPRVRNLPNRIFCRDDTGEMDCVFFNSYEGYIKKILPLNKEVIVRNKHIYYNSTNRPLPYVSLDLLLYSYY